MLPCSHALSSARLLSQRTPLRRPLPHRVSGSEAPTPPARRSLRTDDNWSLISAFDDESDSFVVLESCQNQPGNITQRLAQISVSTATVVRRPILSTLDDPGFPGYVDTQMFGLAAA